MGIDASMKIYCRSVQLPHINYTIRFRNHVKPDGTGVAWAERDDRWGCTIYLTKRAKVTTLAHELVHALRYICEDRQMDFTNESEHMAYIMQYVMGQALDYAYVKSKPRR
jgi:hypothetical protein